MLHRAVRVFHRSPAAPLVYTPLRFCSMATIESLSTEIARQTELFNKLRLENSDTSVLDDTRKRLGDLKKSLGALKNAAGVSKDAGKERLLLKTPKVRSCLQ